MPIVEPVSYVVVSRHNRRDSYSCIIDFAFVCFCVDFFFFLFVFFFLLFFRSNVSWRTIDDCNGTNKSRTWYFPSENREKWHSPDNANGFSCLEDWSL